MRWAYLGTKEVNETAGLLAEYNLRGRLHKIGFNFDGSKIDYYRALCFATIGSELDAIQSEEMDKITKKQRQQQRKK